MIGSTYTAGSDDDNDDEKVLKGEGETLKVMTLEELLPMSFGPEFLGKKKI